MSKVRIKLFEDNHYSLKFLYRKKIDVYNIEYSNDGNIYTIEEKDLEKLELDNPEILSYKGIRSLFIKLKRNLYFLISIVLAIFVMCISSRVVINVNIVHSNKDIRALVEDELYDLGIKPFIFKKSFSELQKIKEKIKNDYPENIEWLEIVDDGMRYTVRVEERIITEDEEEKPYCDIVSTKDAVVLNIVSSKGQSVVGQNDLVKKDSTLISGQIMFNESVKSHVCAQGEVYGNTWYRVNISVPYEHETKEFSGKSKSNVGFEYGSTYGRVFKVHYSEYEVAKKKIFSLGSFAIYKEKVSEYQTKKDEYTEEEALEKALEEAREKLLLKLDKNATILNEKVLQSSTYDSIINVEVFYSVKELIGKRVEREIQIEEGKEELE